MQLQAHESQHSKEEQNGAQYRENLAGVGADLEANGRKQKSEGALEVEAAQLATISDKPALMRLASSGSKAAAAQTASVIIKPTWKRYLILLLFALNSGNKSYQWLQVPSSTTKATILYETDNFMINAASIIFMVSFIVLSWPACYVIENVGMRKAVVVASLGTAVGAVLKCFSCHKEGIWFMMLGSLLVSLSEQLIFSLPSRLASVWFPDHQVSLCVALCVVGGQMGLAMGFLVPQWFLNGMESREQIAQGFYHMFLATAIFSLAILAVCVLFFDDEPAHVPGAARQRQLELERKLAQIQSNASVAQKLAKLFGQIRALFGNRQLMLLATSYGIIVGLGYSIHTLLDQTLKAVFPEDDLVVGNTGFLIVVAGIFATPVWGRAMDAWHAFKSINLVIAAGALLSLALLAYVMVWLRSVAGIYLAACLFGLFHTGFICSGLEFAVELTYPAPELVTSSVMNLMPQIYSIAFIFAGSYITDNHGVLALNIFNVSILVLGFLFLLATREKLKRQEAIAQMQVKPARRIIAAH